jgi:hypothetical protein
LSEGLPLLCVRVNQARQLAQNLRGHGLKEEVADAVLARLRECAAPLGSEDPPPRKKKTSSPTHPTRRRQLWRRDPRCF